MNDPSTAPGAGRAYVLDDEAEIGALVAQVLVACRLLPRQFTSPEPFLDAIKDAPPELVVLDLALGQSDAIEVMRQLEILKYRGKVLLISGRDEATLVEITQIGERHGLTMLPPLGKPFRAGDVKNRLLAAEPESLREARPAELHSEQKDRRISVHVCDALRNDWLELWYQPKIELKSLTVCGAEALLRARHPEHGIVGAADVLPPAGDPAYWPLSEFVIARAKADRHHLAQLGMPLQFAINMPACVIHAPDFVHLVRRSLPANPDFTGLIIELTEDDVIRDPVWVREIATQLKLYNVWISIDDFGTGYASLSRLHELPFVEVKIDRGLVAGCSANPLKRGLCQTVVDLAHRFGASVCAEGVETAEDLRTLRAMGCDTAQGYLFSRPVAPKDFETLMRSRQVRPGTTRITGAADAPRVARVG
jgi:EAL domain-containing protein (putative c-di-GMP-specific phosphodiesterase class I)/FixJ family two-component response regulator